MIDLVYVSKASKRFSAEELKTMLGLFRKTTKLNKSLVYFYTMDTAHSYRF
jgi:hypothetical protein